MVVCYGRMTVSETVYALWIMRLRLLILAVDVRELGRR